MLRKNKNKLIGGYTIIETMIALAIFLIVIVIGVGSLLNASLVDRKSKDMRSIIDSLSYSMDDMSRNIRTGYNYHCLLKEDLFSGDIGDVTKLSSCQTGGGGIAFESSDGSMEILEDQWFYYISQDGKLFRSTEAGKNPVQMTPNEVVLDKDVYSFSIIGAESDDKQQPLVIIRLAGKIISRAGETSFSLQTAVSQRLIDSPIVE